MREATEPAQPNQPPPGNNHPNPAIPEAIAWINSLKPSWAKAPHLTATEMHDLAQSAGAICALADETKDAVRRYAANAGGNEWIFQTRQRFIANYTEAVQRATEADDMQPAPSIGMGSRKPRKITDLRQTTQQKTT